MTHMLAQLGSYIESTAHNPHIFTTGCLVDMRWLTRLPKDLGFYRRTQTFVKIPFRRHLEQILQRWSRYWGQLVTELQYMTYCTQYTGSLGYGATFSLSAAVAITC